MKRFFFLLASAATVFLSCGHNSGSSEQSSSEVPAKRVLTVKTSACKVPYTFPAQLRGKRDISIFPQVEGTLDAVLVSEGQNVKKGQKMFIVNPTAYQAAVENARAAVNIAKTNVATHELEVNATRELFEKGVVAEHQYKLHANALDVAKAQLEEAEAGLKHALNNLNHTVVTAPNDGVVGTINYRQGSLVGTSIPKPLTIVSDNSTVYAYISVNYDEYIAMVRDAGSKDKLLEIVPEAELILGNGVVYEHKGHLETVSGIIDDLTGTVSMRVAFDNPDGMLSAGGSGTLRNEWDYTGILIPRSATFEIQNKTFVYKVNKAADGTCTAESCEISVYRLNDSEYIVDKGLADGDVIVTEGVSKMSNGMEITTKE